MKRPSGEQVSLGFYFHDRACADGMRDVVGNCLNSGASFSGEVIVSEFDGARNAKFLHIYSETQFERSITEQELERQMESRGVRMIVVGVWNAIGLANETPEIVTFNGVSAEAPENDSNPISIVGEGWHFSTPGYERERDEDAQKCYRRFVRVCTDLRPAYAAILNEDSLPCPYDLRRGKGTDCFANFFISEQAFGAPFVAQVESICQGAHTERLPGGLYVATWMFAPDGAKMSQRPGFSQEVVALIANRLQSAPLSPTGS